MYPDGTGVSRVRKTQIHLCLHQDVTPHGIRPGEYPYSPTFWANLEIRRGLEVFFAGRILHGRILHGRII